MQNTNIYAHLTFVSYSFIKECIYFFALKLINATIYLALLSVYLTTLYFTTLFHRTVPATLEGMHYYFPLFMEKETDPLRIQGTCPQPDS